MAQVRVWMYEKNPSLAAALDQLDVDRWAYMAFGTHYLPYFCVWGARVFQGML